MAHRINTLRRYHKIKERFDELYKVQRRRYDDVMAMLSIEFCMDLGSIARAINTANKTEKPKVVALQIDLFAPQPSH